MAAVRGASSEAALGRERYRKWPLLGDQCLVQSSPDLPPPDLPPQDLTLQCQPSPGQRSQDQASSSASFAMPPLIRVFST